MTRSRGVRGARAVSPLVAAVCGDELLISRRSIARALRARVAGRLPATAGWQPALPRVTNHAFTIIELLVVISIVIVLAGLILSTSGYVQKKGARSRAEAEIAALSAALESYKADNGIYPQNNDTDQLDPVMDTVSTPPPSGGENTYSKASLFLYTQLTGMPNGVRNQTPTGKSYFSFKNSSLYPPPPSTADVVGLTDPFGYIYGYSTKKAKNPSGNGYNPTFDLWSTAGAQEVGESPATYVARWIKNW